MSEKKVVIGIAGTIGSGKGTITQYTVDQYGATQMRYSKILQDILERLSLEYDRKNLAILAEALRHTFGGAVLSRALISDISKEESTIVVFEGIRKKDELDHLRTLENFHFIYVDAEMETRYRRLIQRNEKVDDNVKSFEDFKKDHLRPADKDVPLLMEEADYIIDNNGSQEDAKKQANTIIKQLIGA